MFMKKIALSVLAVTIMIIAANAQTEKGDWMVGGNIAINTPSGNSEFTIAPMGGYFFANNFVAGLNVNMNFETVSSSSTAIIAAGPFARYYINIKNSTFKPFFHAEYNLGNAETKVSGVETSNTTGAFFLGAGGAFFINPNVALEAVAGYNHTKVQGADSQNGFLFRLGFQIHLLGSEVERVRGR
jgi:hypothetical protein